MVKALKLLKRILIHKFWVAYYCFQIGLYKQGITHDLSKFSITEFSRSVKYWDDKVSSLENEVRINGYSETFLHHRGRNPHHYEYWIHSLDVGGVPARMPRKYAKELVCDYLAACKTYGGDPRNEIDWWNLHCSEIKIHEDTKSYVSNILYGFHTGLSLKQSVEVADMLWR